MTRRSASRALAIRAFVVLAAVFGSLAGSAVVHAQPQGWLPDRQQMNGPGFRVRNLEIHPSFQAEAGVDNNVFLQRNNTTTAGILRLTGHVAVSTLGPQRLRQGDSAPTPVNRKVIFRGSVGASYYHYFTNKLNDNVGADANIDLRVRPDARVGFQLYDRFIRTIRPFVDQPPGGVVTSYGLNQNTLGANILANSRGGVLRAQLGYDFGFALFDSSFFRPNNYIENSVHARAQFTFLPRTSLFQSTAVHFQNYTDAGASVDNQLSNNTRVESEIGLNGAITQRLSVTASGGYAAGFYKTLDNFSGGTWRGELRYRPSQTIQTGLGYARTFSQSWLGGFTRADTVFAHGGILFGGKFLAQLNASVSFNQTGRAFVPGGASTGTFVGNSPFRKDTRVGLDLMLEYRATDWLGISATVGYIASFTNYAYTAAVFGTIPDPGSQYQRVDGWLGLRVFY